MPSPTDQAATVVPNGDNVPEIKSQMHPKIDASDLEDRRADMDASQPTPKRLRVIVDDRTLRFLLDRYRVHYAEFGKNKKVTQLIPNKVWTKVVTSVVFVFYTL
jgi:hypothetical protein